MKPEKCLKRLKILTLSLSALVLGCALSSCGRTIVFVLNEDEVVDLKKGQTFTAPYDGVYYSDEAEARVMDAKRIKTKLK